MIQVVINYIGAAIRWVFESIWRRLTNKEMFTFEDYLNGPKEPEDLPAATRRRFANFMVAAISILIAVILVMKFQESQ